VQYHAGLILSRHDRHHHSYLALGNVDKAIQYLARKGDALGLDAGT
jgi:hypothetical protein